MRKDHVSERFVIVNPENGKVKATKKNPYKTGKFFPLLNH